MNYLSNKRILLISAAIITILTILSFLPAINNGFINLDDDVMLTGYTALHSMSPANIAKIILHSHAGLYHPVVSISYMLEYHFFGLDPRIYHLTNIIIHSLNASLVLIFAYLLTSSPMTAFLAALLFGIHPVHVESVAWVTERKDMLYAFFYMGSLVSYCIYINGVIPAMLRRESGRLSFKIPGFPTEFTPEWLLSGGNDKLFYILSLGLFILSLLSKPAAVTLPAVLLLVDYFKGRKFTMQVFTEKIPHAILSFAIVVITISAQYQNGGGVDAVSAAKISDRILFAAYGIIFYIGKLIFPFGLSAMYPYKAGQTPLWILLCSSAAIIAIVSLIINNKNNKTLLFCSSLFVCTLLPSIQLMPAGLGFHADRYTYVPSVGFFILCAGGIRRIYNKRISPVGILLILAVSISLSYLTYERTKVWSSSLTLWNDVIKKYPGSWMAYRLRADAYKEKEDYSRAMDDYAQAIKINPRFAQAHNNRGNLYHSLGDTKKAIMDYTSAIEYNPLYADAYYNRGLICSEQGRYAQAYSDYSAAIRIQPAAAQYYNNRGIVSARTMDYNRALEDFNIAIDFDPSLTQAHTNRTTLLKLIKNHRRLRKKSCGLLQL